MLFCTWTQEASHQFGKETSSRAFEIGTVLVFDNTTLQTVEAPRCAISPSVEVLAVVEWIGDSVEAIQRYKLRIERDIAEMEQRADFERRMMQQYPASRAGSNYYTAIAELEVLRKTLDSVARVMVVSAESEEV